MSQIIRPWTSQPQQVLGVEGGYSPAGVFVPGLGDVLGLRNGSGQYGADGVSPIGRVYAHTNGSGQFTQLDTDTSTWLGTGGGFSLLVFMRYGSTLGTGQGCGPRDAGAGLGPRATLYFGESGFALFDYGGATSGSTRVRAATATSAGTIACYIATTGPRGMDLWCNGRLLTSNTANPTRSGGAFNFAVGDVYGGTAGNAEYSLVVPWNAQLPQELAQQYSEQPWQLFRPRSIWVPVTAGGGGTTYNQTVSGIFVPSGTLSQSLRFGANMSGSVSPSGVVRKEARVFRLGSLPPSGTIVKQTNKRPSGSFTVSGSLGASTGAEIALAGSITLSGALQQAARYLRSYSSVLTPSGALRKMTLKGLSGSIAVAGQLAKGMFLRLTGSITPTGEVSGFKFTPTISNVISTTLRSIRRFIGRR